MVFTKEDYQLKSEQKPYVKITCIICLIVLWTIYLPITLHFGRKFFRHRNFQVLKKRYSDIACIEIVLVTISFIFTGGVILADFFLNVYLRNISFYTGILVQYCILYCWLWRFWLLFYDIKWMNESLNVEWKRLINPHVLNSNFFIDRRKDYGNKYWIGKRIVCTIAITACIVIGLRIKYDFAENESTEWIGEIPYLVFFIAPFLSLGIILYSLPQFDDNIFVAREMKLVIFVLFFIIFSFFVQEIFESAHKHDENVNIEINVAYYIVIESCNFACILITTCYVMHKVQRLLNQQRRTFDAFLGNSSNNPQQSLSNEMAEYVQLNDDLIELQCDETKQKDVELRYEENEDDIGLVQILSHPKSFDLFVNHVAKEFSIECLLSYIEFIQFKKYMHSHLQITYSAAEIKGKIYALFQSIQHRKASFTKEQIDVNIYCESDPNSLSYRNIKFPANVPKSEIVFQDDINFESNMFKERSKHKIYRLYAKYVKIGCELEINISYRSRQALFEMIDNYDNWMTNNKYKHLDAVFLMHMFDKSISQMIDLLKSSFIRFRQSNQFEKLKQLIFVDK